MGKKGKDKKKGKGADKTAAKTDKKLSNKLKKELKASGEEDIESIVAQIESEEKKRLQVTETAVDPPSRRLNFSLIAHPEKEQLILYGGEFYNGQKTFVYGDLFFYNIPSGTWSILKAPAGPPPRCGHQMIASSANKGELWLFGGEYVSPSQTQFYHYRDLWIFHIAKKEWQKIDAPNGPSARSGHRMVYLKKKLFVFGGFHDNSRSYKYFNDVHVFDTETYTWSKLETSGTIPPPRSACCMVGLKDGRILIYGGYSKEKLKKDVDKGQIFTDSYILAPQKNDESGTKWKWIQTKLGGIHLSPRCSMPMTSTANNTYAYSYGGVFDMEEDEDIAGTFYNDFNQLDLEKLTWKLNTVASKKDAKEKVKVDAEESTEMEVVEETVKNTTISDDGVFKVTVGPSVEPVRNTSRIDKEEVVSFQPSPRINCGLAIKHGIMYLYGGMFEDGDKEVTYCDLYSIDLKKMDEWKVLIRDDASVQEWLGSESETDSESDEEEDSISEGSDMDTE